MNPLLDFSSLLPHWQQIKIEHIVPALEQQLTNNRQLVEQCLQQAETVTWQNFAQPLADADDQLSKIWAPVSHLHGVQNNAELREVYDTAQQMLTAYSTEMGQNTQLYQAWQQLKDSDEFNQLNSAQQKAVDNALRDFRLAGVALNDDDKTRYGELKQRMAELTTTFSNNVLDATQAWLKHLPTAERLAGIPETVLPTLAQAAQTRELEGYALTLDFPCYLPVMQYCDDRELRQELYTAFVTRASDKGDSALDNSEVMVSILQTRTELAKLLGFDNYAQRSLATKMADTPEQVIEFLQQLANNSLAMAKHEFAQLQAFADSEFGLAELAPWDVPYYSEKLRQQQYDLSPQELRPWFPVDKVITGMFGLTAQLYDVEISVDQSATTYHDDVAYYQISRHGQPLAGFYLDAYAREGKRGGAWMAECTNRACYSDGSVQQPVAFLVCNFTPPTDGVPALLTHDEVTTLFHEFGHGLHHMLTQVDAAAVAGINGVAWDAVELPSQFMENWCWQSEGLEMISGHYETGEPLPTEKLERLLAAKNFQSGMQMVRQIEFSLFDMHIHLATDGFCSAQIQQTLATVRQQVAVVPTAEFNRFQHSFSHIFAGGYAAGYYSYKWAEVLSSDAFAKFEEDGIFNASVAAKFLHEILEQGGSKDAAECFKAFRGRQPDVAALLRHSGIVVEDAA